ncbi:MAG: SEL1-like repeat protein [Sphingomonadaceae bacterium]|nr:SEL1-like repeat protein [Sphingomonadaceae bacterium]
MMVNLKDLFLRRAKPAPLPTPAELDAAFLAKDFATAISLTRRLAESGDAAAQYRLGEVFEYGLGVLQDFAQALDHYEQAAEAGYADAWAKLGDF